MRSPQVRFWLLLSLLIRLITAHFSVGYFHPDEHFQILEFLGHKVLGSPATDLPWEFPAEIRPWFQPGLYNLFARAFLAIGLEDTRIWAEWFRQFSGLLAWGSSLALLFRAEKDWKFSPQALARTAALFALLWFLPFVQVRTSSESLSSSFFFLGLATLTASTLNRRWALLGGLLLGLSFECRFQSGFLILGLGLWLLFQKRLRTGLIAATLIGFLLALVLGFACDSWGYGHPTFTAWNYFTENILHNRAAQWGVKPWWGYFELIGKILPPLGLLIFLATLWSFYKAPRHPLTWSFIPFLVVHCLVGHKEARFLTSLFWAAPLSLEYSGALAQLWARKPWKSWWLPLWTLNTLALIGLAFLPARTEIQFLEDLYAHYPQGIHLYGWNENPFELAGGLKVHFFTRPTSQWIALPKPSPETHFQDLPTDIQTGKAALFHEGTHLLEQHPDWLPACHMEYSTFPPLFEKWTPQMVLRKTKILNLYRCAARPY